MMPRYLLRDGRVRIAAIACALATAALAMAVRSAVRVETSPAAPVAAPARVIASFVRLDTTSDLLVGRAIDKDPFGSRRDAVIAARRDVAPAPINRAASLPLRLVGTVIEGASGDFALCQLGNETPKMVRVGQSIGDYVLRRVTQGAASFDSPAGGRMELRVSKPGS
jgi:hypothetical protein